MSTHESRMADLLRKAFPEDDRPMMVEALVALGLIALAIVTLVQ